MKQSMKGGRGGFGGAGFSYLGYEPTRDGNKLLNDEGAALMLKVHFGQCQFRCEAPLTNTRGLPSNLGVTQNETKNGSFGRTDN